jgi:hypothetical protein
VPKKNCHPDNKVTNSGNDKGEGDASIYIRWLGERTAGPHSNFAQGRLSTSLRFGRDDNSYFGRVQVPKKNWHPDNKVTNFRDNKGEGGASLERLLDPWCFSPPWVGGGPGRWPLSTLVSLQL